MENYIKNTDLINAYINKTLSEAEKQAFENRLETDSGFNHLYNEQLAIIEGTKRVTLKAEINAAKQSYIRIKWMRYIGVSVGVILILGIVFSLLFQTEEIQKIEFIKTKKVEHINSIIRHKDSTLKKYTIIFKKDTAILDKEKTNKYLVNYYKEKQLIKFSGKLTLEEFQKKFPKSKHLKPVNDSIIIYKKIEHKFIGEDFTLVAIKKDKVLNNKNISVEEIASEEETTSRIDGTEQSKKPEPTNQELISFFKSVKKAPQIIEVNTEKEFTIICKEGTKLTIPAQSFVEANTGKLVQGKINIEVTEYYKLSDMLLANLSTKSDDKQLETGGMLYLDANKNGQKLKIKKRLKVSFPSVKKKTGMQLFTGDSLENRVNWKTKKHTIIRDTALIARETVTVNNFDRTLWIKEILLDSTYIVSDAFYKEMVEYEKKRLVRRLGINENEKVIIRKPLIDLENSPFKVHPSDSISRGGHIIRKPLRLKQQENGQTFINFGNAAKDDKYNVFEISKLGWINCDRFVKSNKRKIKYKLKIKNADGADLKMIFKSISSILPSKKYNTSYDFGSVPLNEKITLVAIKEKEGKFYLDIKDADTNINPEINFNFKEVTIQELKKELEQLNDSF